MRIHNTLKAESAEVRPDCSGPHLVRTRKPPRVEIAKRPWATCTSVCLSTQRENLLTSSLNLSHFNLCLLSPIAPTTGHLCDGSDCCLPFDAAALRSPPTHTPTLLSSVSSWATRLSSPLSRWPSDTQNTNFL